MTPSQYLDALRAAAAAGDAEAAAMLAMIETYKPEPFASFPPGL
jgi:hypothetical protein